MEERQHHKLKVGGCGVVTMHIARGVGVAEFLQSVSLCYSAQGTQTDGEAEQAIVRRVLLFLHQHGKKELEKYTKFFKGYSCYRKAGVIEDMEENFSRQKEDLL